MQCFAGSIRLFQLFLMPAPLLPGLKTHEKSLTPPLLQSTMEKAMAAELQTGQAPGGPSAQVYPQTEQT
jgi:hypothetical protein